METSTQRLSGVLVHPTSFPSPYGIGELGSSAYDFIDFLEASGQHLWQVLPLGPTGFGDSPYQGFSAFAGQPLIISIEDLLKLKLLTEEDIASVPMPEWDPRKVDYGEVLNYKTKLFHLAYEAFPTSPDITLLDEYEAFCTENASWLNDYALFMAGKDAHGGKCWLDWEEDLRCPTPGSRKKWSEELQDEINYYKFLQFLFRRQWMALKEYANDKDISIIGDIPIFMSLDSADVWSHQDLFQLDPTGHPTSVAGVPPDYFSETGQLWGNPLYDWDAHKKQGYRWWIDRIKSQMELVDYLRIDHFRGFEAYWSVPADEETAINGKWIKGPREDFFLALQAEFGKDLPIFAEDLGIITPEVEWLRDMFGFPGMKVLQFAFQDTGESVYLPHQFTTTNCICYTGTHDNDTTAGWYAALPEECRDKIRRYGNTDGGCISLDFIRFCMGSIAKYAIFPIQDLLQLGSDARMNTPGAPAGNWMFRYGKEDLNQGRLEWLKATTKLFGR